MKQLDKNEITHNLSLCDVRESLLKQEDNFIIFPESGVDIISDTVSVGGLYRAVNDIYLSGSVCWIADGQTLYPLSFYGTVEYMRNIRINKRLYNKPKIYEVEGVVARTGVKYFNLCAANVHLKWHSETINIEEAGVFIIPADGVISPDVASMFANSPLELAKLVGNSATIVADVESSLGSVSDTTDGVCVGIMTYFQLLLRAANNPSGRGMIAIGSIDTTPLSTDHEGDAMDAGVILEDMPDFTEFPVLDTVCGVKTVLDLTRTLESNSVMNVIYPEHVNKHAAVSVFVIPRLDTLDALLDAAVLCKQNTTQRSTIHGVVMYGDDGYTQCNDPEFVRKVMILL